MTDNIKSSPTAPSRSTSTTSSSTTSSAAPVALPSDEALELLLSPDGYYTYLSIPKPDPSSSLTNPYLDAAAASGSSSTPENSIIDLDQVKKNYRRLSLKHHPDRRGGNEETFRALNRAKIVLSSPKLRREYDLIGLDLEDDAEDHHDDHHASSENTSSDASKTENDDKEHSNNNNNQNKTETVMSHLASATLAGVLQMVVRTALMGVVSVLLSRYTILTIVTLGMLVFLSTRIYSALNVAAKGGQCQVEFVEFEGCGCAAFDCCGCVFHVSGETICHGE